MTTGDESYADADLHDLRASLAGLHEWAERALNDENCDRQLIAEHLSAAAEALAAGRPEPVWRGRDIAEYRDSDDEW